jgi:hypothetical protein
VLSGELSVWSARHRSTPIARPFGSSFAAASNTAPRPQPRSSSVSSPWSRRPLSTSAQAANFPTRVVCTNTAAVPSSDAAVAPATAAATGLPLARLLAANIRSAADPTPTITACPGADTVW